MDLNYKCNAPSIRIEKMSNKWIQVNQYLPVYAFDWNGNAFDESLFD